MFAFVILTFGICWLPYHVYFIYSYHNPQVEPKALGKGEGGMVLLVEEDLFLVYSKFTNLWQNLS